VGRLLVAAAVTASAGYAVYLIPGGTGVEPWLVPAVIAAALVADVVVLVPLWRTRSIAGPGALALAVAAVALLLVPSVASATVVADARGPFDTPFEPTSVALVTGADARRAQEVAAADIPKLEQIARASHTPMLFVTDTSVVAADYIVASGREVLPIGGFTGAIPSPTLKQITFDIAFGQVRLAVVPVTPPSPDPRIVWIRTHCLLVRLDRPAPIRFGVYDCHDRA
jgi:hypothetical protein